MKIFICEQDPYRAKLIQDILGVYNYKLITVNEQNRFFEQAHSQKPAVIVMDSCFADNSNQNMINRLRKDPVTSQIPVIYISSNGYQDKNEQPKLDDLTAVVNEPLKIKNFRHYIDRWTTLRSLYIRH